MKKMTLFLMACVAVTLLSCEKEVKVIEVVDPQEEVVVPEENVLEYHAGIGIPETKTDLYGTKNIHWKAGDKILAKVDGTYESFILNEGAGTENATFTYSGSGSTLVGNAPAFYGYKIGETGGFSVTDATHVTLPDTYAWSDQGIQAPMMDADGTNGSGKFTLMGAVLKVDVENIPAAANKLVFTATGKNISGAFEVTSGAVVLTDGSKSTITITFTAGEATSRTFFIPLPTGTIPAFSVSVYNGDVELDSKNASSANMTLSKGDIVYVPAIAFKQVDEFVVWQGSHDCGESWTKLTLSYLSYMTLGDIIHVEYTEKEDSQGRLFLKGYSGSEWANLTNGGKDYVGSTTSFDCTLTSSDKTTLANNGLQIDGYKVTVTKVSLIKRKAYTETELWDNTQYATVSLPKDFSTQDGYEGMGWNNTLWTEVQAGDILRLTLSSVQSDNGIILRHEANSWGSISDPDLTISVPAATNAVVEYPFSADVLSDLQTNSGLVIIAYHLTLDKAEIITRSKVSPETVLWKGSCALSWDTSANIIGLENSSFWSSLTSSKTLSIYYSAETSGTYCQVYLMSGNGGTEITTNAWNNYDATGVLTYTGAVLTNSGGSPEGIKELGLSLKGDKITITKITLK